MEYFFVKDGSSTVASNRYEIANKSKLYARREIFHYS